MYMKIDDEDKATLLIVFFFFCNARKPSLYEYLRKLSRQIATTETTTLLNPGKFVNICCQHK